MFTPKMSRRSDRHVNPTTIPHTPAAEPSVLAKNTELPLLFLFADSGAFEHFATTLPEAGNAHLHDLLTTPYTHTKSDGTVIENVTLLQYLMLSQNWYLINILTHRWPQDKQQALHDQLCDFERKVSPKYKTVFDYDQLTLAYQTLITLLSVSQPNEEKVQQATLALGAAQKGMPHNLFFYLLRAAAVKLSQSTGSARAFHEAHRQHNTCGPLIRAQYRHITRDAQAENLWKTATLPESETTLLTTALPEHELAFAQESLFWLCSPTLKLGISQDDKIAHMQKVLSQLGKTGTLFFSNIDREASCFSKQSPSLSQAKYELTIILDFLDLWQQCLHQLRTTCDKIWCEVVDPTKAKQRTEGGQGVSAPAIVAASAAVATPEVIITDADGSNDDDGAYAAPPPPLLQQ